MVAFVIPQAGMCFIVVEAMPIAFALS